MPKIPTIGPSAAPSGFLTARPNVTPIDVGALGQGLDAMQRGLDQQRREVEAEEKHLKAQADAADRATAQELYLSTQDTLADEFEAAAQGVVDGSADKTSAVSKWTEKSRALVELAAEKIPPAQRQVVQARLLHYANGREQHMRRAVAKRDRADVRSAIDSTLEHAARMAETDYAGARHLAMQTLAGLGSWGGMDAAEITKRGNAWREEAAYVRAAGGLSRARTSVASIQRVETAIQGMEDLDPRKRVELLDKAQGYRLHLAQRAEIEANRAERLRERAERKAGAAAQAFMVLADKGGALSPQYVDTVTKETAGTPWAAVVRATMEEQKAVGGFASLPLAAQRRTIELLDQRIAKEGRDPTIDKQRERFATIYSKAQTDIKTDPLEAFAQRGGEPAPRVDMTTLDTAMAGMAAASQHAANVAVWAGRDVSPLYDDQAAKLAEQLNALPPAARAEKIATLSTTMNPRQASALAQQIDKKGDKAIALQVAAGISQTTHGRRVAELIGRGAQARIDKVVKENDDTAKAIRADVIDALGDSLTGKGREDVIEAAMLIAAGQQATGGTPSGRGALRLAIAGDIIEHRGLRIPVPPGVTAENLPGILRSSAGKSIATQATDGNFYAAGVAIPVDRFLDMLPEAQLQPAGHGKYYVRSGGDFVKNKAGARVVVEVPAQ